MNLIKKLTILGTISIGVLYFAQDISNARNVADVYSDLPINGSARFSGMAGSMGAMGGDVSAMGINPAVTGVYITGDLSAGLNIDNYKNSSTHAGKTLDYNNNNTVFGHVGGVASFRVDGASPWKFVNLAFNFNNRTLDSYVQTPGNDKIYDTEIINGSIVNFSYNGHAYNRFGTQSNLNFGIGANYDNKIYLGAGLNFKSATIDQGDVFRIKRSSDNATTVYNKQYTPYTEVSSGFSANIGAIGKVNPNFRVGLALESPTFWNLDRVYSQYSFNNNNISANAFSETITLITPFKATLSGAFIANKDFALNVDFIQELSNPKFSSDSNADKQLNNYFTDSYKKSTEVRVGGEYRIQGLRLRAGYAFRSAPFKSGNLSVIAENGGSAQNMNLAMPYMGARKVASGGIGYDFNSFYIDAAYQNIRSEYDNAFFAGEYASVDGNDGVDNANSITSKVVENRNRIVLTLGWKF